MGDLVNQLLSSLFGTVLSVAGGLVNDAVWMFGSFVLITADPTNSQTPLTQMAVIQRLVPLTQTLGDAGLTAAVIWSTYKEIWGGGQSTTSRSRISLRRVIPRLALSALLINTCLPLIQLAIDADNAICRAIVNVTEVSAQSLLKPSTGRPPRDGELVSRVAGRSARQAVVDGPVHESTCRAGRPRPRSSSSV